MGLAHAVDNEPSNYEPEGRVFESPRAHRRTKVGIGTNNRVSGATAVECAT